MPDPALPSAPKAFNPRDPNPCAGCSNCCEYLALEIDRPRTVRDFDHILWYVLHKDVWVYIDDEGGWFIQFNTPCEKLVSRRCTYYGERPAICRDYAPRECVRYVDQAAEKALFKNEKDFLDYLKRKRPAMYRKLMSRLAPEAP
ncbi:MAG: YkgJ family cysteine cluster protein [Candidatus Omnitrophica bacterium]|nr:YkgJ family cysteine cluster protein [Candidatus Omnitrophota bacterium]